MGVNWKKESELRSAVCIVTLGIRAKMGQDVAVMYLSIAYIKHIFIYSGKIAVKVI